MTDENKYSELAMEMNKALAAAKSNIQPNILGKAKDMQLEKEDYRMLGTSIFIEKHYAEREAARKSKNGNGSGDYSGPSTEAQQSFIGRLLGEREGASEAVAQFLDTNGGGSCMDLTSSLASSLIDTLKALPKRKK